jgi:hypothetical protein
MPSYRKTISVDFDTLPALNPQLIKTDSRTLLARLVSASDRRRFSLAEDWAITVGEVAYGTGLNGRIRISRERANRLVTFDGASVPFPWLVSLLSFGVFRPMGVMLTGSIVHDVAYACGSLEYETEDGRIEERPIERHDADQLFCDIIGTVNDMPEFARIAWLAVRLGWTWVRYGGEPRGGKAPVVAYGLLALLLTIAAVLIAMFGVLPTLGMATVIYTVVSAAILWARRSAIAPPDD